ARPPPWRIPPRVEHQQRSLQAYEFAGAAGRDRFIGRPRAGYTWGSLTSEGRNRTAEKGARRDVGARHAFMASMGRWPETGMNDAVGVTRHLIAIIWSAGTLRLWGAFRGSGVRG